MRKLECGLRPIGAIGAYAPEGMGNFRGQRHLKAEGGMRNAEFRRISAIKRKASTSYDQNDLNELNELNPLNDLYELNDLNELNHLNDQNDLNHLNDPNESNR
jgi:hypothetical protein